MATAVLIAGAVGAWVFVAGHAQDCAARWADSGLRVTYRDGQCLVEAGGRFYPERSIKIWTRVDPQRDGGEIRTAQESD